MPMSDLRKCLEDMGLKAIKTYLQTGNVVFESSQPIEVIKKSVEATLSDNFRYQAFVQVYPYAVLSGIIHNFPFLRSDDEHGYVIFCESENVINDLISHEVDVDNQIESIKSGANVVYWRVPKGKTLGTSFSKILMKPKYKATTTNRNINTLEKML